MNSNIFFLPRTGQKNRGEGMLFSFFHFCPLKCNEVDVRRDDDDRERARVCNIIKCAAWSLLFFFFKSTLLKILSK